MAQNQLVSILCQSRLFTPRLLNLVYGFLCLGIHPLSIEAIHSTFSFSGVASLERWYPSSVNRGYSLHCTPQTISFSLSLVSILCQSRLFTPLNRTSSGKRACFVSILCQSRLFTPHSFFYPELSEGLRIHPLSIEAIHSTRMRMTLGMLSILYPSSVNRGYSLHDRHRRCGIRRYQVSILCQSRLFTPRCLRRSGCWICIWYPSSVNRGYSLHPPSGNLKGCPS